jgi:hypothetical protein
VKPSEQRQPPAEAIFFASALSAMAQIVLQRGLIVLGKVITEAKAINYYFHHHVVILGSRSISLSPTGHTDFNWSNYELFSSSRGFIAFPDKLCVACAADKHKIFSIVDEYLNCLVGSRVTFNDGGIFTRSDGGTSDGGEMLQIDLGFSQQFTSLPFSINSSVEVIFNLIMTLHFFAASFMAFTLKLAGPKK